MIPAIINRLSTGSISTVVFFGDKSDTPKAPYVVVKQEASANNDRINWRIIAHVNQGNQSKLNEYIYYELASLLSNQYLSTAHGAIALISGGEISGVIMGNDDGTIAMERVFFTPLLL